MIAEKDALNQDVNQRLVKLIGMAAFWPASPAGADVGDFAVHSQRIFRNKR
ncbi:hypothetical protein [Paraburkholderia ginsengisoli]|uniref:Uncharacterized protein n=1 Tax=Paraburkholderia ginsengisoli TaxID=311231 RepID=A0A7T4N6U0_9BURK|nr:hypothetical protein [Paraburkholderia ginsengisoli]QQC66297.1 hypothetical protein I6I06_26345 [Paraburkholderia ginsengisoli]